MDHASHPLGYALGSTFTLYCEHCGRVDVSNLDERQEALDYFTRIGWTRNEPEGILCPRYTATKHEEQPHG